MSAAVFTVPLVPPSINTNAVRSHWRGFHTHKKRWQSTLELELMALGLPRPIPCDGPLTVEAVLFFPTRHRRDSENFRPVLSKALGDALVNGGWLADDTDTDWRLSVRIDGERKPAATVVRLAWAPAESEAA